MLRLANNERARPDRFLGYHFDSDNSELTAMVLAGQPERVFWTIHLEWVNEDESEPGFVGIWAEIPDLAFSEKHWRDLVGKERRVSYPTLRDNPSNFCSFAKHDGLNQHHIRIGGRDGRNFTLHWTCMLEVNPPPGEALEIIETVAFKAFAVHFPNEAAVNLEAAQRVVNLQLARGEFGEPVVSGQWVRFPVRTNLE